MTPSFEGVFYFPQTIPKGLFYVVIFGKTNIFSSL